MQLFIESRFYERWQAHMIVMFCFYLRIRQTLTL